MSFASTYGRVRAAPANGSAVILVSTQWQLSMAASPPATALARLRRPLPLPVLLAFDEEEDEEDEEDDPAPFRRRLDGALPPPRRLFSYA